MNHNALFFRKTFFQAIFLVLIPFLVLKGVDYLYVLSNDNKYFDYYTWNFNLLYSSAIVSLFALILPWISLLFCSEMFYTRSLPKKELFMYIWKEYMLFFLPILGYLFAIIYINRISYADTMNNLSYKSAISVSSITLFLALVLAGNSKLFLQMLTRGIPLFIFLAIFGTYSKNGIEIGSIMSGILWFTYIGYYFFKVYNHNDDIDLNVPGKPDDENRATANLFLFSKEFAIKKVDINKTESSFGKLFNQYKLVTSDSFNSYSQILFFFLTIAFFFVIRYGYNMFFEGYYSVMLFDVSNISMHYTIFNSIIFLTTFIIILSNPKYLFSQKEEFLFTRGLSRSFIYGSNLVSQGLFVAFLSFLSYLALRLFTPFQELQDFNMLSLLVTYLWFFISGEVGLTFAFILISFDLASTFATVTENSNFFISFLINLHTTSIFTSLLWIAAILVRFWDYRVFLKKELGFFHGISTTLKNVFVNYVPSFVILIALVFTTSFTNPFTRIINFTKSNISQRFMLVGVPIMSIFNIKEIKKLRFPYSENELNKKDSYLNSINTLLRNPYNSSAYLDLASKYIDTFYTFYSNYSMLSMNTFASSDSWENKDEKEALKLNLEKFLTMAESEKNNPKYYKIKGILHIIENDYIQAEKDLNKLLELDKSDESYFLLGSFYKYFIQPAKELALYEQAVKNNSPFKGLYLRTIGNLYWNKKMYDKAFDYYIQASLTNENINLPRVNYYSQGLCPNLKIARAKYSNKANIFYDTSYQLSFCENGLYDQKFKKNNYFFRTLKRSSDIALNFYIDSLANDYNASDEKTKWLLEHKEEDEVIKLSSQANSRVRLTNLTSNTSTYTPSKTLGKIALNTYEKGNIALAEKIVANALEIEALIKYRNSDPYDPNNYLALVKIFKDKNAMKAFLGAKKLLLVSNFDDLDKNLATLKDIFSKDSEKFEALEKLKIDLDSLYTYFENNGLELSNKRSFEITKRLVDISKNQKLVQFKNLENVLDELYKYDWK